MSLQATGGVRKSLPASTPTTGSVRGRKPPDCGIRLTRTGATIAVKQRLLRGGIPSTVMYLGEGLMDGMLMSRRRGTGLTWQRYQNDAEPCSLTHLRQLRVRAVGQPPLSTKGPTQVHLPPLL